MTGRRSQGKQRKGTMMLSKTSLTQLNLNFYRWDTGKTLYFLKASKTILTLIIENH